MRHVAPVGCVALIIGSWLAGCAGDDSGASTSMQLVGAAAVADEVSRVELSVFDQDATCNGPDAVGGAALPDLDIVELAPMDSQTLFITAGPRIFFARAYDDNDMPLARGCTAKNLVEGEMNSVTITFTAYDPAATGGDSPGVR